MRHHDLVTSCRGLIGVDYVHAGRSRRGVDCCGMIALALKNIGVEIKDATGYSAVPDGSLIKWMELNGERCQRQEGRVGVFWFDEVTKVPQHVGVFTNRGIIHCYSHVKKVTEHRMNSYFEKRLLDVFRCKWLED